MGGVIGGVMGGVTLQETHLPPDGSAESAAPRPLGLVVVALEVFVFEPRGIVRWMIGAGAVGAALVIGWLAGYAP